MLLRAALALLPALSMVLPLWAEPLRVGRAAVKITPAAGIPMAGYYSFRLSEGTHDDLFAKALVLESGDAKVALVACDLVDIDEALAASAREAVHAATGIVPARIMISATHSHTGPLLNRRFLATAPAAPKKLAEQYRAALPQRIVETVRLADQSLTPARAWTATGREESLGFYRRFLMKDGTVRFNPGKMNPDIVQPMGSIDPDVALAYFDSPEGRPLSAYVNFALHLDTVGGAQFSADYPYTLAKLLAKLKGPEMLTIFTIGAAGNINHIDVSHKEPQKGHLEAQRIGTVLAGEVLKTMAKLKPATSALLQSAQEIVPLPIPSYTAAERADAAKVAAQFGAAKPPPFLDLVHAMKVLDVAERKGEPLAAEVQVITLGDQIAWVALPGEIFVELGVAIKKASPFPQTIIVELANGSVSYVPTKKAYAEGAYEATSARAAPGGGELLAETAIRLLALLHRNLKLQ